MIAKSKSDHDKARGRGAARKRGVQSEGGPVGPAVARPSARPGQVTCRGPCFCGFINSVPSLLGGEICRVSTFGAFTGFALRSTHTQAHVTTCARVTAKLNSLTVTLYATPVLPKIHRHHNVCACFHSIASIIANHTRGLGHASRRGAHASRRGAHAFGGNVTFFEARALVGLGLIGTSD